MKTPAERAAALNLRLIDVVSAAWDDRTEECPHDCAFLHCWTERHPYGMGTAAETLCDCEANERNADECPRLESTLRRLEDAAS